MAKKTTGKAPESTVYIGRSFPGLPQYTVFRNGELPGHIAGMVAENENIAGLIVPVSGLQEARKNMLKKGHILNFYARKLMRKE